MSVLSRFPLLGLLLVACEGQTFTRLSPPLLVVNVAEIDFGQVPVGFEAAKTVTLANAGEQPLTIRSIALEGTNPFGVEDVPTTIGPGLDARISVTFAPTMESTHQSNLVIDSNASNSAILKVPVKGSGVPTTSCGECDMPPAPWCLSADHRVTYSQTGTCVMDKCEYTARSETCTEGCEPVTKQCLGTTVDAGAPDATVDSGMDAGFNPDAGTDGGTDAGAAPRDLFDVPGEFTFVVPNVTEIRVRAWGGGGQGGNQNGSTGGGAGFVEARVPVTPNESLAIWVAQGGGFGGGTALGNGGGATYVRRGTTNLIIAAGGGGGGSDGNSGNSLSGGHGGAGGGVTGETGGDGVGTIASFCTGVTGGTGASQSSGGAGGTSQGSAATRCSGQPGARDVGGRATGVNGNCDTEAGANQWHMGGGQANGGGGGGGAGYFGGGGAGFIWTYCGGGGGGGASFTDGALLEVSNLPGHLDSPGMSESHGAGQGGSRCFGGACATNPGGNGRVEIRY